jgi:hypothetical protein
MPSAPKPKPPGVGDATSVLPSPPKALKVTLNGGGPAVAELIDIANLLTKLNDSQMLSRTRQVSNFFDQSLIQWINKRNGLVYRNAIVSLISPSLQLSKPCNDHKELQPPQRGKPSPYFVPALYDDVMLNCLMLADIRVLANFESPAGLYNPPQFGERIGAQVDINPGALPRDPYYASVLAQVLLFFVIVYFSAFAREAASLDAFPSRGTLFGAFSGSRVTLLVFLVALWSPVLASLSVAATSRQWPMYLCSIAIIYAVLSAHRVLQQRSYWAPLINLAQSWQLSVRGRLSHRQTPVAP